MFTKRLFWAFGLVLILLLGASRIAARPDLPTRENLPMNAVVGPLQAYPPPTIPALNAFLPVTYKNFSSPTVRRVWRLKGGAEYPQSCEVRVLVENTTSNQVTITRVTAQLLGAGGQAVGRWVSEPGASLWILEPGEQLETATGDAWAYGPVADVRVQLAWHPSGQDVVGLTVTQVVLPECPGTPNWREVYATVQNPTQKVVQRATLFLYGEDPLTQPWWSDMRGDAEATWQCYQYNLSLQPGETRDVPLASCSGAGWPLDAQPVARCIALAQDLVDPVPPTPEPTVAYPPANER